MSGENTQDLNLSTAYRYVVRGLGHRRDFTSRGDATPEALEYGTEVVDTWTGDVMTTHWAATANLASLVAETQCAERNAPEAALVFASSLSLFMDRAVNVAGMARAEVYEDVATIVDWHLGRLRGLTREPLDMARLHVQAPEFNR